MRHIIVSFLVVISLLSVSCTSKLPSFRPYKMDIQQGNVVTSKMMLQLRPGMTKSQVRFIMGTPLIQDSFHSNRWDYFYQMRKEGKIIEQRRVILDFEKEALLRVRGDVIPAGTGDPAAQPTTGTEPVSQPEDKKSLVDKLKFWKSDKSDKKEQAPEPQAAPTELVNPTAKPADMKPAAREAAPASPEAAPAAEPASPEPAVESQPTPAPAAQPALAPEPVTDPAEPAPAVQPAEPAKAEEPASVPAAKPEPVAEPAPQPAPAPVVEPEAKPAAVEPVKKPVEKAAEKPAAKPAAAPAAEKEPPREDEPGYFEYMLEKIGF